MFRTVVLATAIGIALLGNASAQSRILDKQQQATPGETVRLDAAGFHGKVDVYFDTAPQHAAKSGDVFSIQVPVSVLPGKHWVTLVERKSGDAKQVPLKVSTDWREYGFDAHGTRNNFHENVISKRNVSKLALAWQASVGNLYGIITAPIVIGDALYVSGNGSLQALDALSGEARWSASGITSQPAGHNGVIYAGGSDNKLYAFNAATGAVVWSSIATGRIIDAPPVVEKGIVYVGSEDGHLYAFKAKTGALLWATSAFTQGIATSVALSGDAVYLLSEGNELFGYDARTGTLLWSKNVGSRGEIYSGGGIAAVGGLVYASTSFDVNDFDDTDGTFVTRQDAGASGASPAIANGMLFTGDPGFLMEALSATAEHLVWVTSINQNINSSPAVANGIVYAAGFNGALHAFDVKTGAELWSSQATSQTSGQAVTVANGLVYITANSGYLYAYALNGGKDPVYHRDAQPPSLSKLHPNLK